MKKWVPHNYQITALNFILKTKLAAIFLDPGLGKTSIMLWAIKILITNRKIKGVLVIAPLRVAHNVWPFESTKWENFSNLTSTVLHGKNKNSIWGEKKDIYIINPEGIPWLYNELLSKLQEGHNCPFNMLVVDESTKFKSHSSSRFKLIKDMLSLFDRRYVLTGTPSPSSYLDLWSQMYIVDQGDCLGSNFYSFRNKYFLSEDWNKYSWKIREGSSEEIQSKISHTVLDMAANKYLKLPKLINNFINVNLDINSLKKYKEMEKEFFAEIDGHQLTAQASAQSCMKCHQLANGNIYEDIPLGLNEFEIKQFKNDRKVLMFHTKKLDALEELIGELRGKPLLVAYHYKHDLSAILSRFGGDTPYIGSGVSPSITKDIERRWNEGGIPLLLAQPKSMAHGLNFQEGGNDLCWYSLTWSLEDYIQFIARINRQGASGNSIRCHHIVAKETIDEAMILRLGQRAKDQIDLRLAIREYRNNISSV